MREHHYDALFYFMQLRELSPIDLEGAIYIGEDMPDSIREKYSAHLHAEVYPPGIRSEVTELVADGHEKVLVNCSKGKFRKKGDPKQFTHGWFMVVDPKSKHVVSVQEQVTPEGNVVVRKALEAVLPEYPKCDALIMDRACSFAPSASKLKSMEQLKFFIVDKFHARTHSEGCKCNPWCVRRLMRRIKGVNTSVCRLHLSAKRSAVNASPVELISRPEIEHRSPSTRGAFLALGFKSFAKIRVRGCRSLAAQVRAAV